MAKKSERKPTIKSLEADVKVIKKNLDRVQKELDEAGTKLKAKEKECSTLQGEHTKEVLRAESLSREVNRLLEQFKEADLQASHFEGLYAEYKSRADYLQSRIDTFNNGDWWYRFITSNGKV